MPKQRRKLVPPFPIGAPRLALPLTAGFSLIEVIIVVALIAFIYTVAMPQFSLRTGAEVSTKLNELASDIRNAYDLAVLSGKPYRLVFQLNSGNYWLEEADRPQFLLGADRVDRDPTEAEEKEESQDFDNKFRELQDLAGQAVMDEKSGKEIAAQSPVVMAKTKLKRASWSQVDAFEWAKRSLGPHLLIKDMQSEHHGHRQELAELGPEARAMVYFFPSGYVERAVLHIFYKKDDLVPDESQEPYTVITNPYEGVAEVLTGNQEVDVHNDKSS